MGTVRIKMNEKLRYTEGEKSPKLMLILKNILKGREEKTGKLLFTDDR